MKRMKRFSVLPITLYRIQARQVPQLRQKSAQFQKGRTSFDYTIGPNKLYNPAEGDKYLGPNGLSLRPVGVTLAEMLQNFNARYIYELPKDLVIPDNFVMIHQRSDHYSLQTKKPIDPNQFCIQVGKFFQKQKRITQAEMTEKVLQFFKK